MWPNVPTHSFSSTIHLQSAPIQLFNTFILIRCGQIVPSHSFSSAVTQSFTLLHPYQLWISWFPWFVIVSCEPTVIICMFISWDPSASSHPFSSAVIHLFRCSFILTNCGSLYFFKLICSVRVLFVPSEVQCQCKSTYSSISMSIHQDMFSEF